MTVHDDLDRLATLLLARRFRFATEEDLQRGIESVLVSAGEPFRREERLTKKDRVDFLAGTIGIEVKIGGSLSQVTRQLLRYAPHVDGLILVTARAQLDQLPPVLGEKPLRVVSLLQGLR